MSLLDNLERKYRRYSISNLMKYIITLNAVFYILSYLSPTIDIESYLTLNPAAILHGEIWRLVTFIFIPPAASPIFILFILYFSYLIGNTLEIEWGSFRFNLYYLLGMIGTIAASFITGQQATAYYLNTSLFFAFAYLFPNFQILLFFILPIKIKWIAWLTAGTFILTFITGSISVKLVIVGAVLNFFVFFGKDIFLSVRDRTKAKHRKQQFQKQIKEKDYFHKCVVCGITDKDDPNMDFRYCSSCEGHHEYCMNHLKNHEHINK